MTTKTSVVCWDTFCTAYGKRVDKKDLLERVQDYKHTDFICPICEHVLICKRRE